MVGAVLWSLLAALLLPSTQAQSLSFNVEDLLGGGAFGLIRSGTPSSPCLTPGGQQGTCGSATTCQAYLPLLDELRNITVINFFRKRVCRQNPGLVHVCCPSQRQPEKPPLLPRPQAQPSPSRPQNSPAIFTPGNQSPKPQPGGFGRPSQRPNARRPAQDDFRGNDDHEEDDEVELPRPATSSTHIPPTIFHIPKLPPPNLPRPTQRPTTTAPTFILSPQPLPSPTSNKPDRATSPGGPDGGAGGVDTFPTEPSVPSILPAEGECGTIPLGKADTTPWAVGVGVLAKSQFQVLCGGALISRQHVIIAAHCLHPSSPSHVRLGDLQQHSTLVHVPLYSWVDAGYSAASRNNDLALLTLVTPIAFTDTIRPVCLPFRYRLDGFRDQRMQVVGWNDGLSQEAGLVQVIGTGQCQDAYGSSSNNEVVFFPRSSTSSTTPSSVSVVVDRRHLCVSPAPLASSSSTCLSDFGAPLFYHDEDTTGLHFLVGISSLGDGCRDKPGLYTRLGAFFPWLVKQLMAVEVSSPAPSLIPARSGGRSISFGV